MVTVQTLTAELSVSKTIHCILILMMIVYKHRHLFDFQLASNHITF